MNIPEELKYTSSHEWVREEGDTAVVGITDHAQEQLGDVVFVELPEPGTTLEAGESLGVVESVKAVSDLYAPVAGEVVEVNEALVEDPELLNQDPYGDGWILKMRVSGGEEDLLSSEEYGKVVQEETE